MSLGSSQDDDDNNSPAISSVLFWPFFIVTLLALVLVGQRIGRLEKRVEELEKSKLPAPQVHASPTAGPTCGFLYKKLPKRKLTRALTRTTPGTELFE